MENTHDKVTDEVLLASVQQRLKLSDHVSKKGLHNIALIFRLTLRPEFKLFFDHAEVVLNVVESLLPPHFVHRRRQVVRINRIV